VQLAEVHEVLDVLVHRAELVVGDREREQRGVVSDRLGQLLDEVVPDVDVLELRVDLRLHGERLEAHGDEVQRVRLHRLVEPREVLHRHPEARVHHLLRRRAQRVVVEIQRYDARHAAELRRDREQRVRRQVQLLEVRQLADCLRDRVQLVLRQRHIHERRQPADPRRQLPDLVLVEVQHLRRAAPPSAPDRAHRSGTLPA